MIYQLIVFLRDIRLPLTSGLYELLLAVKSLPAGQPDMMFQTEAQCSAA